MTRAASIALTLALVVCVGVASDRWIAATVLPCTAASASASFF